MSIRAVKSLLRYCRNNANCIVYILKQSFSFCQRVMSCSVYCCNNVYFKRDNFTDVIFFIFGFKSEDNDWSPGAITIQFRIADIFRFASHSAQWPTASSGPQLAVAHSQQWPTASSEPQPAVAHSQQWPTASSGPQPAVAHS